MRFRQAIWWEAAYQLAARGLHREADEVTRRYRQACDDLLRRLPGLAEGDIPGFGVSIGQRAYYAGEFRIALDAYRKEWQSGPEQHRSRLQRLIANVFTDLGALTAASRLANEALIDQEVAGDPEAYKTLGRCGEICPSLRATWSAPPISIGARTQPRKSCSARRCEWANRRLPGTRGLARRAPGRGCRLAMPKPTRPMRARIPASTPMP
jgi:hypothetical protein